MSVICPYCGKENTSSFRDKKLKTTGYECLDCHRDFGVDDGKKLEEYQASLTDFFFSYTDKTGFTKQIKIHHGNGVTTLSVSTIDGKGLRQPYEPRDITPIFDELKTILFKKVFLLDWERNLVGLLLPSGNEKYEIKLSYGGTLFPDRIFKGVNRFPPYLKALRRIFDGFFPKEDKGEKDGGSH